MVIEARLITPKRFDRADIVINVINDSIAGKQTSTIAFQDRALRELFMGVAHVLEISHPLHFAQEFMSVFFDDSLLHIGAPFDPLNSKDHTKSKGYFTSPSL